MTDSQTPATAPQNDMTASMVMGVARSVLLYEGGQLVASHAITSSQESQLLGAALALVGVGWSLGQKWWADQKFKAALAAPPPAK